MYARLKGIFILFLVSFLFFNFTHAQDPGEPDTVRFEKWGTCVPCPPCSGTAVVPVVVFNDEELNTIEIPVEFSGPVTFDSGRFVGRIPLFLEDSMTFDDFIDVDSGAGVIIIVGSYDLGVTIQEGYDIIAHLFLTVSDTGLASIDQAYFPPDHSVHFFDSEHNRFIPVFLPSEYYLGSQEVLPGDIDDNGVINLSDAIGLANYFLKGGPPPVFSGSADVNTDCQINFSDIILIAKWYFTGQTPLQPGCAY